MHTQTYIHTYSHTYTHTYTAAASTSHLWVRELLHKTLLALDGVGPRLLHCQRNQPHHELESQVALGDQDEDLWARETLHPGLSIWQCLIRAHEGNEKKRNVPNVVAIVAA